MKRLLLFLLLLLLALGLSAQSTVRAEYRHILTQTATNGGTYRMAGLISDDDNLAYNADSIRVDTTIFRDNRGYEYLVVYKTGSSPLYLEVDPLGPNVVPLTGKGQLADKTSNYSLSVETGGVNEKNRASAYTRNMEKIDSLLDYINTRVDGIVTGSANIYNTNDTLTADRSVDLKGKTLSFETDSTASLVRVVTRRDAGIFVVKQSTADDSLVVDYDYGVGGDYGISIVGNGTRVHAFNATSAASGVVRYGQGANGGMYVDALLAEDNSANNFLWRDGVTKRVYTASLDSIVMDKPLGVDSIQASESLSYFLTGYNGPHTLEINFNNAFYDMDIDFSDLTDGQYYTISWYNNTVGGNIDFDDSIQCFDNTEIGPLTASSGTMTFVWEGERGMVVTNSSGCSAGSGSQTEYYAGDECYVVATGPGVTFTKTSATRGDFVEPAGVTLKSFTINFSAGDNPGVNYDVYFTRQGTRTINTSVNNIIFPHFSTQNREPAVSAGTPSLANPIQYNATTGSPNIVTEVVGLSPLRVRLYNVSTMSGSNDIGVTCTTNW